jgi:glycine cleavage system H protein
VTDPASSLRHPENLRYTAEHEWVDLVGDIATVGITAHAADQLGDIVFVALPAAGQTVTAGSVCGELESTKSVSDLYAPVTGTVTGLNDTVAVDPSLINAAPFDEGWLFRVHVDTTPTDLITAAEYTALIDGGVA